MTNLWKDLDLEKAKISGKILSYVLTSSINLIKPGVSAHDLDTYIENLIKYYGAYPSFKGFNNYPYSSCISVNDEIVHGLPDKGKVFNTGDIITVDIGVSYDGHCTDAARTMILGKEDTSNLLHYTRKALYGVIEDVIEPGACLGDIGFYINKMAILNGFSVPVSLGGHGIGKHPHLPPFIPNYGIKGTGEKLISGMYVAIEPIFISGCSDIYICDNGWAVKSINGEVSAHFEDTIYVGESETLILTNTEEV